jgi:ribosomal protein L22
MADEKDKKEKTATKEGAKESKAAKAKEPAAKKATAKKEPKAKKPAAKKDAAEKKDSKEKPAKKAAPKADKDAKAPKADKEDKPAKEKKPRRRAKKAAAKAEEKPAKKASRKSDELPVVHASAKYVRVAPRKARLIADQVRGLHIEQARALLAFSPRTAAEDIHKLINSAAANAENNHDLIGDEMRISSITVDEGPTLRRFRPRALGRATPINKRTSHIAVALTPVED